MNQNIIKITVITLLLGTTVLFAKGEKFEQSKEIILTHVTKNIELSNQLKKCIESSTNRKAIKVCRQSFKSAIKALRAETKAKREALKNK
jgi:hypothetical protein